jgi:transcriptional regulator with XRE-family HTH domain
MTDEDATEIGRRVRSCRRYRGVSLQVLADRSGLSKSFLSMVENGRRQLQRRQDIFAIADALQVSVADLTGAPFPPTGPSTGEAHAAVPAIRLAYLSTSLDHSDAPPGRPATQLLAEVAEVMDLRQACRYADVAKRLPALLHDLHAAAARGPGQREALQAVVHLGQAATRLLMNLGYAELAWIAADRGAQAAQRLGDPLWIAAADFTRVGALLGAGARQRAAEIATRSADSVPTVTQDGLEVRGMLLLHQAFAAATGASGVTGTALDEAQQIAERTGQGNAFWFMFGPANVALWRVTTALELGDPSTAIQFARTINLDMVLARSRRAGFLTDYGRALASDRRIPEAVDVFRQAERLNPDSVRNSPLAREAVQGMLLRERRAAGDRNLRGLAARMGVVPH